MSETYELAVIGAGPAGLEAAITAAEAGVKTVLIDAYPQAGGQYYKALPAAFSAFKKTAVEKEGDLLLQLINGMPITRIYNALTWGIFKGEAGPGWLITLYGAAAPKQVHALTLVLACGAYDTPVAFPGWTLPGVITCGAALTLLKNQRSAPFRRALFSGTGPLLLSGAAHMIDAGVEVLGVCESNRIKFDAIKYAPTMLGQWQRLEEGAKYLSILAGARTPYKLGWSVVAALGKDHVEEAVIAKISADGQPIPGTEQTLKVDTLVCGYGLTPNSGLARLIGCKFEYQSHRGGWIPWRDEAMQTNLPGVYAAGDCAGIGGAENSRLEGRIAGTAAALQTGHITQHTAGQFYNRIKNALTRQRRYGQLLGELFSPQPGLIALAQDDTIVCRCEEISLGEVKAAVAAGARTIGEVKMVTRVGMGNCQGRMCEGSVLNAVLQELVQEKATAETIGMYSIRPPLQPLPIGVLAAAGGED
ncbi:MAG: FAD-dependent oxidoreductase [Anaerolineaceae bacterium]|nr:FAD-dependent oxidoreductase [Anaerolineaceae bacterium]